MLITTTAAYSIIPLKKSAILSVRTSSYYQQLFQSMWDHALEKMVAARPSTLSIDARFHSIH